MLTISQKLFSPGLPNLGAQIRCTQKYRCQDIPKIPPAGMEITQIW